MIYDNVIFEVIMGICYFIKRKYMFVCFKMCLNLFLELVSLIFYLFRVCLFRNIIRGILIKYRINIFLYLWI